MILGSDKWLERDLSCWSKIPCGSPTISETQVNYHQDFGPSTHIDFFPEQMDRAYPIGLTIPGKTQLCDSQLANQGQYSQHFIFFVSYKWAQQAKVLHFIRLEGLSRTNTLAYWAHP